MNTPMFRAGKRYQMAHPDNGKTLTTEHFYFDVDGNDTEGFTGQGSLTGFVTREQFNALAACLGLPQLPVQP